MVSFVKANMLDAFENIQSFNSNVGISKVNSTVKTTPIKLLDELVEKFAQSFAKGTAPDEAQENEAKYLRDLVDKNKNGTVSINELESFDSSNLSSEAGTKINDLKDKFKLYDKDQSGELSLTEIKNAIGKKQYSLQELKAMSDANKAENEENVIFNEQPYSFPKTALDNYKKANSKII